jgi:hypothetical protein
MATIMKETITGVSPDQATKRYLTIAREGNVAEVNIHSASGSGAYIHVSWGELEKVKTQPALSLNSMESERGKSKKLVLELKEKQSVYIHTITEEGEEGSGWAISVSRDELLEKLNLLS